MRHRFTLLVTPLLVTLLLLTLGDAATAQEKIATSHRVWLENGTNFRANLVQEEEEVIVFAIGGLGTLTVAKDSIDRVEAEAGSIELPQEPPATPQAEMAPVEPEGETQPEGPAEVDPVTALIEAVVAQHEAELERQLQALPGPEVARRIDAAARLLTHHENTDRTRAENQLRRIGKACVPYLGALALHPFELTRRPALRLVRDLEDARGVPIALNALLDPDRWVRQYAHEALQRLVSDGIRFDPQEASVRERLAAREAYHERWLRAERARIENELLARLDGER